MEAMQRDPALFMETRREDGARMHVEIRPAESGPGAQDPGELLRELAAAARDHLVKRPSAEIHDRLIAAIEAADPNCLEAVRGAEGK